MLETSKLSAAGAGAEKPAMASVVNKPNPMRRARCIMGRHSLIKADYSQMAIIEQVATALIVGIADGKLTKV
jgi:hypothetical protein